MSHKLRNMLIILAFTVLTLTPIVFAQPSGDRPFPPPFNPEDFPEINRRWNNYIIGKTVISSVNTVLLGYLFITYYVLYRNTKSTFTLGLVLMTVALLIFTLFSNPLIHWFLGDQKLLGAFNIIPDLFTTIATIILIYLSRQ